ncbi:MAG: DNA methyltransferase 1-associated protein 1 [Candelina submexicana]|nr:MAG: DNA methyltransferase 1-associated protein 1 [Candelina submexicana]
MTSADVRDMLDLPSDGHPRPAKKQKTVDKRPEGITRELYALLGERAPPVAITDHVKYKDRPKWSHKVQPWEETPFVNSARTDGLVLKHWRRKRDPNAAVPTATEDGNHNSMTDGQIKTPQADSAYYYAKFNVKVSGPQYDETQYNTHLRNDDWSKEETDYLVDLALGYDLRWVVIADRYDYQAPVSTDRSTEDSTAIATQRKPRTMEDMKARYYDVAAKILAANRPVSSMSSSEYDMYESMTKFSPAREKQRKNLAEALLSRSLDEIKEEEILLGELKRIVGNQEKLMEDRKELYARLEPAQGSGVTSNMGMYQSFQGLSQLMQTLVTADKTKKRRSLVGPGEAANSPTAGTSGLNIATGAGQREGRDGGHREPAGGPGSATTKKGSVSGVFERKQLTEDEEKLYGVSHHDRLTSGVQFRHDKITKLGQARSNVQATKVSSALTELQIPPRLVMPTVDVCAEYERLIQSINTLIDVRKLSEKVDGEIKVALAQREERERKERAERGEPEPERQLIGGNDEVDMDDAKMPDGDSVKQEGIDEGINGARRGSGSTSRPATSGGHKRSASVLSVGSNKSTKRQKK